MEAQLCEPAAAPYPVRLDGVYQSADNARVYAVGKELCAFCHSARNDGRGSRAEHEVEYELIPPEICVAREDIEAGLTDKTCNVLAEKETEADSYEGYRSDTEVHKVFHDDVARVLRTGEACLHHREARLHKEHKSYGDHEPYAENRFIARLRDLLNYFLYIHN